MESIYKLQKRADTLRKRTQTDSISPEDVGGLHYDTLEYIAGMERSADGLGIRKIYKTSALMEADIEPVGTNGKALRFGQLVCVYDSDNPTSIENGNIYAWQNPGWLLMGNISNIEQMESRLSDAETRINTNEGNINVQALEISGLKKRIDTNEDGIKGINDSIGTPNGIAPLGPGGKVLPAYLPGYVDDVVEFGAFASGISVRQEPAGRSSSETGCMVVYNSSTGCFVLGVSDLIASEETEWEAVLRPSRANATTREAAADRVTVEDYWDFKEDGTATLITEKFTYYTGWDDADAFGTVSLNGRKPEAGKIYVCTSMNTSSRWSGSGLVTIGSILALGYTAVTAFPGDEGAELREHIMDVYNILDEHGKKLRQIRIVPFSGFYEEYPDQSTGVWFRNGDADNGGYPYMWANEWPDGTSETDYNMGRGDYSIVRDDVIFQCKNDLYRFDGEDLVKIGAGEHPVCVYDISVLGDNDTYTLTAEEFADIFGTFEELFENAGTKIVCLLHNGYRAAATASARLKSTGKEVTLAANMADENINVEAILSKKLVVGKPAVEMLVCQITRAPVITGGTIEEMTEAEINEIINN